MSRSQPISVTFSHSRWGRAALHLMCLARGGRRRWHLRGIFRELFGIRQNAADVSPAESPFDAESEPQEISSMPAGRRQHLSTSAVVKTSTLCAFLLCALLSGELRVIAFPGAPALDLLPSAQVDSSGIYLHQILANAFPSSPNTPPIRLANAPA